MRNMIIGLLYELGIGSILRRVRIKRREVSILTFHRVSDEDGYLWCPLSVATFRSLMEELAKIAYIVRLEEVGEIAPYPDRPIVVLSFDDGYMDFWLNALPILREFGLPAHHNICPGLIDSGIPPWTQVLEAYLATGPTSVDLPGGGVYRWQGEIGEGDLISIAGRLAEVDDGVREAWIDRLLQAGIDFGEMRLMGWNEVAQCLDSGISIGSHGMNHRNLAKISDERMLYREIAQSKKKITDALGVAPEIFSFPNGLYDEVSINIVKKSGYQYALLCDDSTVPYENFRQQVFHVAPRIAMRNGTWKEENLRFLGLHQRVDTLLSRRMVEGPMRSAT